MRFTAVVGAAMAVGCGGNDMYYQPVGVTVSTVIHTVNIQTNKLIRPDVPGQAVNLFVDYAAGGTWRIQTICDVLTVVPCDVDQSRDCSPPPCAWDIVATARTGGLEFTRAELDPSDRIYRVDDAAVRLMFDTASEIDGVSLTADPGAQLQLDVFLDGYYDTGVAAVSWVLPDQKTPTSGAPSNPVVFSPTAP